jgi:hypothetical protein
MRNCGSWMSRPFSLDAYEYSSKPMELARSRYVIRPDLLQGLDEIFTSQCSHASSWLLSQSAS